MARRRMIDPSIWDDDSVGSLSSQAFKLFIGCISLADDEGRLEGGARKLKGMIFRYDDTSVEQVEALLSEIENAVRSFVRYTVEGRDFIAMLNWKLYQKLDHPQRSRFPAPPSAKSAEPFPEKQGTAPAKARNRSAKSAEPHPTNEGTIPEKTGNHSAENAVPFPKKGVPVPVFCDAIEVEENRREENLREGEGKETRATQPPVKTLVISPEESEILTSIKGIPGLDVNDARTVEGLKRYAEEFPTVDISKTVRDWIAFVTEKGVPKNWLLQIRNFVKMDSEKGINLKSPQPKPGGIGGRHRDAEEQVYAQRHKHYPEDTTSERYLKCRICHPELAGKDGQAQQYAMPRTGAGLPENQPVAPETTTYTLATKNSNLGDSVEAAL